MSRLRRSCGGCGGRLQVIEIGCAAVVRRWGAAVAAVACKPLKLAVRRWGAVNPPYPPTRIRAREGGAKRDGQRRRPSERCPLDNLPRRLPLPVHDHHTGGIADGRQSDYRYSLAAACTNPGDEGGDCRLSPRAGCSPHRGRPADWRWRSGDRAMTIRRLTIGGSARRVDLAARVARLPSRRSRRAARIGCRSTPPAGRWWGGSPKS